MNDDVRYDRFPTPLGPMLAIAQAGALAGLHFVGERYEPEVGAAWRRAPEDPLLARTRVEVGEYFAGTRERFDLPLAPSGTAFQRAVWQGIATVPHGATITYGELARRIGRPTCVRAAGAATGRNPWTIVVPCHRIVGGGGALTGYAAGLERKRALLALEAPAAPAAPGA